VKPVATGTGDGSSWANAGSLYDMINASAAGGQVWVAAGNYNSLPLKEGVHLYGGFAGVETAIAQRTMTGGGANEPWNFANATVLNGGGSQRALYGGHYNIETVVDGFTLTNGKSTSGGGADIGRNNRLVNCYIYGNTATGSGVVSGEGGGVSMYQSTLIGCKIEGNTAVNTSTTYGAKGGGVYSYAPLGSPSRIENCVITGNTANGNITNSTGGGGIYASLTVVSNCLITGNTTNGIIGGGGSTGTYINCTVVGNTAATDGYGGIAGETLINSIVWGNTPARISATASYSAVQGGIGGGTGNINLAAGNMDAGGPRFVNPEAGDYRLQSGSPCIDAGNDAAVAAGATDLDGKPRIAGAAVDMGAYEYQGNVTTVKPGDINGDGDVNMQDLSILLANFGKSGAAITNPAADINGDGDVNMQDLSILLANFGK